MSGLNGIWYFDSRPVPQSDEAWVLGGKRGPGLLIGRQVLQRSSSIGGGDAPPAGSHPSGSTHEPLAASSSSGSICTWDGRLDNRQDLLIQLGPDAPEGDSASALALRLYEAHGADGFGGLIGDWSLAIADTARRIVLLASDYAGIRPLYYCRSAECVMWSSSLSQLVRWSGNDELDEEYAASFLMHGSAAHRTPYRGIYPAPPGRCVRISPDGVSTHAFWDLPVGRETRFKNPEAYAEQLRHLFREAVAVRLPWNAPVCAELSGGLDSSSIVCMADSLAQERPGDFHRALTFTYTHAGASDEKYVGVVERARNLSSIRLHLGEFPFVAADQPGIGAPAFWGPRMTELANRFASLGAGVFLTGQLGDLIMGNLVDDSEQAVDYLRAGHWLQAAREVYAWSRALRLPVYPLLWRAVKTAYSPWTGSLVSGGANDFSSRYSPVHSLASGLLKSVSRNRAERLPEGIWRQARPSQRNRFRALSQALNSRTLQAPEALQHISYTHPYTHRPLVEFMLTIPPGEVCRPGEPRRLMRRAFASFLPPAILRRKSKAAYADVYRQALLPLAATMRSQPDQIRLVSHGYADRGSLMERLARFLQGLDCNETQLRNLLLFEFWLRNREGRVFDAEAQRRGDGRKTPEMPLPV